MEGYRTSSFTPLSPPRNKLYSYAIVEGGGGGDDNNNNYYYYYKNNNISNYKDLIIEIWRKWNVKVKVIPVTIGMTGTIEISQFLSNIPVKHKLKELKKKKSQIGHSTYTTESANVKEQNIFHGRCNITSGTNF